MRVTLQPPQLLLLLAAVLPLVRNRLVADRFVVSLRLPMCNSATTESKSPIDWAAEVVTVHGIEAHAIQPYSAPRYYASQARTGSPSSLVLHITLRMVDYTCTISWIFNRCMAPRCSERR